MHRPLQGRLHRTMILIEPTIQARFGRALRQRVLAAFLKQASEAAGLVGQVSVLLSGDARLRRLNREFRRKDHATDVLSFPAIGARPKQGAEYIGDIAISPETARRNARRFSRSLPVEMRILILHGMIHLAGFDHESDHGEMDRLERRLRKRLGVARR